MTSIGLFKRRVAMFGRRADDGRGLWPFSRMRPWSMYPFVFVLCAFGWAERADAERATAERLFQEALEQIEHVPVEESIRAFRQVLKEDRHYALAHAQLAKLYMRQGNPRDSRRARRAIDEAIRLSPDETEYQLILGDLLWAQGFRYNADRQYHRVLQADFDNALAVLNIGRRALKEFVKYRHMSIGGNQLFARQDQERAAHYLERSIQLDPALKEAYYHLGMLQVKSGSLDDLIALFRQFLREFPGEADGFLFCGLGYQSRGNFKAAHDYYAQALQHMSAEERLVLEDAGVLADNPNMAGILAYAAADGDVFSTAVDSVAMRRFWQSQNPLFLTDYNERSMAHYARVAYANLCFGIPEKGLAGWQTDKGKTYIKFGAPLHRSVQRAEMGDGASFVRPHLEFWHYADFRIEFINRDGLDYWTFSPTAVGFGMAEAVAEESSRPIASSRSVVMNTPARYIDPYGKQKYRMPSLMAAFKEGDSIRVDVVYAIPASKIKMAPRSEIDEGLFVFTALWDEVSRHVNRNPRFVRIPGHGQQEDYLMGQRQIRVAPGEYVAVLEVGDRSSGSIGRIQQAMHCRFQDAQVDMSDLLLASRIEMRDPFPEHRDDLDIMPNPLRTYDGSSPIFVYLEVYHLTRDEFGRTQFDIAYQLGAPTRAQANAVLFEAEDFSRAQTVVEMVAVPEGFDPASDEYLIAAGTAHEVHYRLSQHNRQVEGSSREAVIGSPFGTGISSRYEGSKPDDFTFLEIDVSQVPLGIYKLTARVTDVLSQEAVEKEVVFRIAR